VQASCARRGPYLYLFKPATDRDGKPALYLVDLPSSDLSEYSPQSANTSTWSAKTPVRRVTRRYHDRDAHSSVPLLKFVEHRTPLIILSRHIID
jgi:hypothetical protein